MGENSCNCTSIRLRRWKWFHLYALLWHSQRISDLLLLQPETSSNRNAKSLVFMETPAQIALMDTRFVTCIMLKKNINASMGKSVNFVRETICYAKCTSYVMNLRKSFNKFHAEFFRSEIISHCKTHGGVKAPKMARRPVKYVFRRKKYP